MVHLYEISACTEKGVLEGHCCKHHSPHGPAVVSP